MPTRRTFQFKMLNAETGQPMASKWCTVLKNADEYVDGAHTDAEGIGTFTVLNYDSTATYQVEIGNRSNNFVKPGLFDITGIKNSIPVIKVSPSKTSTDFTCGEVLYGGYHPLEPYSITDLPKSIQAKTKSLLINRVGLTYYKNLVLNGGQILDLKKFYDRNPKAKENGWIPPAYSLCFMVWDSVANKNLYSFSLKLNQQGKLIGIVELPDIKHTPAKAKIISQEQAKNIAKKENFGDADARMQYSTTEGSILWKLERMDPGPADSTAISTLLINAHSGKIISKTKVNKIVMY
ncbi:PepSY domain-containing protein [Mucilaginibacter celer]|nr:PepSY domain-containing protein [Mucilaginibacter celer]